MCSASKVRHEGSCDGRASGHEKRLTSLIIYIHHCVRHLYCGRFTHVFHLYIIVDGIVDGVVMELVVADVRAYCVGCRRLQTSLVML